ncbi:hypothetical protein [Geminicoccus flavidas]|uniref:hypothetical protein n=1 Tax=Geminicoccus flavidas TaxID=2506407 RepID=UPI001356ADE1|nr:hypothetical protein [Geminicoccus flavidas]
MTVRLVGDVIRLEGACPVEEAEALLALVQERPDRPVDLSGCRHLHGAVLQVLLAFRPRVQGQSEDPFLRDWILPALQRT